MIKLMSQCLLCCGFLSNVALAVDANRDDERIVSIDQEPNHRYVLDSPSLRVFDVFFPTGEVSLYHRHAADSVLVCLDGADVTSEEPNKPLVPRPPIPSGLIYYRPYATEPLVHRVRNIGTTAFRILDIEILTPPRSDSALAQLPNLFNIVIENSRVSVSKLRLLPNQSTGVVKFTGARLLAVVTAGKFLISTGSQSRDTVIDAVRGHLDMRENAEKEVITNIGDTVLELVSVEAK